MVVHPRVRSTAQVPGISEALPGTPIARKYPVVIRRSPAPACLQVLAVLLGTVLAAPAGAASKATVAYLGQTVPGGGQFAGPSFVDQPSAAGNGWTAFRALVVGSSSEQIIVSNFVTHQRSVVASVGGTISKDIGTVKQFLGRPTVNAHGDVVFAAVISPPTGTKVDPTAPTPGGIFLYSQGALTAVAAPGLDTGFGILDLTTQINFNDSFSGTDISERTPALNDNGDVAFVSATQTSTGGAGGAVFVRHAGQTLITPVIKLNDAYGTGTFQILGPPALNNSGTLAFHGVVGGGATIDGIFQLQGGALSLLYRDGTTPAQFPAAFTADPIQQFDDVVVLNDAGDVAFTGGPLSDNSPTLSLSTAESSGIVVIHGGVPTLVGFPGEPIGGVAAAIAKISSLDLGPNQGSIVAPPALLPDGKVIFLAQINGGSAQMILRADPVAQTLTPLCPRA